MHNIILLRNNEHRILTNRGGSATHERALGASFCGARWHRLASRRQSFTDGIGSPDPNPINLVNRCFQYKSVDLTLV